VVPGWVGFGGQTYWGSMPFTDYLLDGKQVERGEIARFQRVRPRER